MKAQPEPEFAPIDDPAFEPMIDGWANYGDAHPYSNGGRFVRYFSDIEEWEVMVTMPPGCGYDDDKHTFKKYWFEPQDVWLDPEDRFTDFTSAMKRILKSLGEEYVEPTSPDFFRRIDYYVADLPFYLGWQGYSDKYVDNDPESYWSKLESMLDGFDRDDGTNDTGYWWLLE